MDQLLVHLIRPPEKVNYGLINEAMMKIEYCSKLLDQLENNGMFNTKSFIVGDRFATNLIASNNSIRC
jgi:hypothetical protein